jgi:hypothetical protein
VVTRTNASLIRPAADLADDNINPDRIRSGRTARSWLWDR